MEIDEAVDRTNTLHNGTQQWSEQRQQRRKKKSENKLYHGSKSSQDAAISSQAIRSVFFDSMNAANKFVLFTWMLQYAVHFR